MLTGGNVLLLILVLDGFVLFHAVKAMSIYLHIANFVCSSKTRCASGNSAKSQEHLHVRHEIYVQCILFMALLNINKTS